MSTAARLFLLLLLTTLVVDVNANHRICGRRLTETLEAVCNHRYHRPTPKQLRVVRRHGSGLATKCCRNRCSYMELLNYCEK